MGAVGEMFPASQEVMAHGEQWVALSAAVPADFLLAATAHVGERLVGETHDVEVVRHAGGVGRHVGQGGPVAGVGVDHDRLDVRYVVAGGFEAIHEGFLGAALDEVPQAGPVEVQEAGHETPATAPEGGLVDAQAPRRRLGAPGEAPPRGCGDRPPRRGPAHPERPRHRGGGPIPSRPGDRRAQPGRQPPPRRHLAGGLGERADTSRRLAADAAAWPTPTPSGAQSSTRRAPAECDTP